MTNSISQEVQSIPVRKEFIGFGEEAIRNTLVKMRDIINQSFQNYYVRRWAENILSRHHPYSDDSDFSKAENIANFLMTNTRYLRDPYGLEMLRTPVVSLQLLEAGDIPYLDCDDLTTLSLSLLKSIGFPVSMRAVSYHPDRRFRHVYGQVKIRRIWYPLDLTKSHGLGWEAPGVTNILDVIV
ncbi:MAG: hypothetical protein DDT19_02918 [Syntrophomonadaceae bacterium]|nr:hypothetical protein [Bacillota bacterium]